MQIFKNTKTKKKQQKTGTLAESPNLVKKNKENKDEPERETVRRIFLMYATRHPRKQRK